MDDKPSFAYRYKTNLKFRQYIDGIREHVECQLCGIIRQKQTMISTESGWRCKNCSDRKLKANEKNVDGRIVIVTEVVKKNTSLTEFM